VRQNKIGSGPKEKVMNASLYERLGGTEGVAGIAGDVVDNHIANPRIAPRFAESDVDAMKHAAATFFIMGPGGPACYEGKDMVAAQGTAIWEISDKVYS
jgi:hemoglobin